MTARKKESNMRFVCFGEIMGRLSPVGYKRFVQADCFEVIYGGGEANVAASLSNFGLVEVFFALGGIQTEAAHKVVHPPKFAFLIPVVIQTLFRG